VPKMKGLRDTRERIIEAAIKTISQNGYSQTTTTLIAKKAKVSQGIIFHYFKTKKELLLAIAREITKEFAEEIQRCTAGEKDPLKKLEKVALVICEVFMTSSTYT